jgi:hypothetical protein
MLDYGDPSRPIIVTCGRCKHQVEANLKWLDAQTSFTCQKCGNIVADMDVIEGNSDEEINISHPEPVWYLAPRLTCRCDSCELPMELPYSNLPQTDERGLALLQGGDPPVLPTEEWLVTFGCRACGCVREYFDSDVTVAPIPKWTEGIYQSGKDVYSVEFPCGDKHCTTPVSMFLDIGNGNASAVVDLLRSGLFDGKLMPCGHEMKTVPATFYKVLPVMQRLW